MFQSVQIQSFTSLQVKWIVTSFFSTLCIKCVLLVMSRDIFTKYRKTYEEESNIKYRGKQFRWMSINYNDSIFEKGIVKYRVKWRWNFYTHKEYKSKKVQKFLDYFSNDIEEEIELDEGIEIHWKDSYIAIKDLITE